VAKQIVDFFKGKEMCYQNILSENLCLCFNVSIKMDNGGVIITVPVSITVSRLWVQGSVG